MTYYEAARSVLRRAGRPLTTREITEAAIETGLISPRGRTPSATMAARLYTALSMGTGELVKVGEPGKTRARRGTVRWTLNR